MFAAQIKEQRELLDAPAPWQADGDSQELFGIRGSIPGWCQEQPEEGGGCWGWVQQSLALVPAHCWHWSAHPPKLLSNEVVQVV